MQREVQTGSSEDEGHYVDLTFTILETESGTFYKKFKVKKEDWADPKFVADANAGA